MFNNMLPRWLKLYGVIGILPVYFGSLLTLHDKQTLVSIPTELGLMYGHYYFFHKFLHAFPNSRLNLHVQIHHDKRYGLNRHLELFIDFLFEMLCFCVLPLLVQTYTNIWICCPTIVFMISLTMTFGHIINYSYLGPNFIHKAHHLDTSVHYGPDFMDHLYGTAIRDHEDGNIHISSILMATCVVLLAKLYFKWKD